MFTCTSYNYIYSLMEKGVLFMISAYNLPCTLDCFHRADERRGIEIQIVILNSLICCICF